jgi:hypothetical protein
MPQVKHPESAVSPKVVAGGVTAALATLIAYLASVVFEFELPTEVAMAVAGLLVTLAGVVASYLKRDPLRQPLVTGSRPGPTRPQPRLPDPGWDDSGESLLYVLVIVLVVLVILALVGVL